ncbi:MAG: cell wall-binding repeat-containing protein [Coriobacteriia bacterium]|nr:cell wall-binding repeat-containing protein [Coriobacteriia bacterium]MBN2823367.1 cell wall-binding repeat-containing protein [Coriobacteriia bacterium]
MNRSPYIQILGACLAALISLPMTVAPATASDVSTAAIPTFSITGTGYGHGIGLSQYGAQGSAIAGKDYSWIIKHYYTGVTLGTAATKNLKVNLDPDASSPTSYTRQFWTISNGQTGAGLSINGVSYAAGTYVFTASGSVVTVTGANLSTPLVLTGSVTVIPTSGSPALLSVKEATGIYGFANGKYRGKLVLRASSSKIQLLNELDIEDYLKGVVPREMPSSWKAEALKAQSIVARSYAYVDTDATLYCTTSSQAYQGYGAYNSNGVWVGEATTTNNAVAATQGMVVKYDSKVVQTFFFSTSGGHTANVEDVWVPSDGDFAAKAALYPYLRGVSDSYEYLASPGYAPWPSSKEQSLTGLQLADKLRSVSGVPASPTWVTGVSVERVDSGHVRYVTLAFSNGVSVKISGDTVRSKLGMLSTRFYFSGFPIKRIEGESRYDTAVQAARLAFPGTADSVVLASGEDFPDALTGAGLAGAADGALLLTKSGSLPDIVKSTIVALAPKTVYIMGGKSAISSSVESAVKTAAPSATVVRIAGANRYETARLAAEKAHELTPSSKVFVVSSTSWADAASVSALAYAKDYPILLVSASGTSSQTDAYLKTVRPETTIIAGGSAVISTTTDARLAGLTGGAVVRLQGTDRYATSAEVARYSGLVTNGETFTYTDVYLATGLDFADALVGGMLAGANGKPLILTHSDVCPTGTATFLREKKLAISQLWLLGGTGAISEEGLQALDSVMMD